MLYSKQTEQIPGQQEVTAQQIEKEKALRKDSMTPLYQYHII